MEKQSKDIKNKKKTSAHGTRAAGLQFCSIASGSSGNSYMIKSEETTLVVDVGISGKRIKEGLAAAGADLENVEGILITHEHSDHVKSIRIMQKHCPFAKVYTSIGTWDHIMKDVKEEKQVLFEAGQSFEIRDIKIQSVSVSHDASDPVAFTFESSGSKIAIVTDTGYVTEDLQEAIAGADLLILESNHDEGILMMGSYPYDVKRRILSEEGHLSNEAAANCLCEFLKESLESRKEEEKNAKKNGDTKEKTGRKKIPRIRLAHLSKENNSPEMAMLTISNALRAKNIFEECGIIEEELDIEVLDRSNPGGIIEV